MVNRNELRSIMVKHGETMRDLGNALGMCYSNISKKMSNKSDWTVSQVCAIKAHYGLTAEDIDRIFFSHECS